jgi:uncharacterized protein YbbC (DUF1343 family)
MLYLSWYRRIIMPQPQRRCLTGLDVLIRDRFGPLHGRRIALLCNQASIASDLRHSLDVFLEARDAAHLDIAAVFGPQHGLWGHTQDNMIEWEGGRDARTGLPVYSLYGERRKPSPESLQDVETFVVDIPDVGARSYTFIWTMALCLEACSEAGIPVVVLDRPNPLGGVRVEGPVLEPEFASFIGLRPLPMRHGMTVGEVARRLQREYHPSLQLDVVEMEGWDRERYGDETGLPWAAPSPNMPSVETAVVFPGMCLLEGTNLSEGRGTTRPFETFGAPWLDAWDLAAALNALDLPGARFRPLPFEPTFDKHAGRLCGGAFLHVLDRDAFEPVLTGIAVLQTVRRLHPDAFAWRPPPFEYEAEKMPIDILAGTDRVRRAVEEGWGLDEVRQRITGSR